MPTQIICLSRGQISYTRRAPDELRIRAQLNNVLLNKCLTPTRLIIRKLNVALRHGVALLFAQLMLFINQSSPEYHACLRENMAVDEK